MGNMTLLEDYKSGLNSQLPTKDSK